MAQRNIRAALQRLEAKLSIEELRPFDRRTQTARIWKVYSYKAILDRRKAAGMEWVIRDKGVRFVDPAKYKTPGDKTSGDVLCPNGKTSPDKTCISSGDKTSPHTLLGLNIREQGSSTSSSSSRAIVDALLEITGHSDDEAARRIVAGCKANAPDATEDEIIDRMRHQGLRVSEINRRAESRGDTGARISNSVGFLISEVPKCFEPHSLATFREARRKALDLARRQREERRQMYIEGLEEQRNILQNPNAGEWERQYAQEAVAMDEEQRHILTDSSSSAEQIAMARKFLCED